MRTRLMILGLLLTSPLAAQTTPPVDERVCRTPSRPPDERIAACDRVLAKATLKVDDRAAYLFHRAGANVAAKALPTALVDIDKALALSASVDTRELLFLRKAEVLDAMKRTNEAMAQIDKAVALRGSVAMLVVRGNAKSRLGQHRAALVDYDRANAAGSDGWSSWNSACYLRAAHLKTEIDRARRECAKALQLKPNQAEILDSMGMVELRAGRYAEAEELFNKAFYASTKGYYASASYGRALAAVKKNGGKYGPYDMVEFIEVANRDPAVPKFYASIGFPDPTKEKK